MNIQKPDGVIVAAGFSSRAAGFKPAMQLGGKSVLARVVESMMSVCGRIIVVGGYRFEELQTIVAPYSAVMLVKNEQFEKGMFSSVQKGLSFVASDRFFFSPGDCPLVGPGIYERLLVFFDHSKEKVEWLVPRYKAKNGHPVLFSSDLIGEVLAEPIDSNLKKVLRNKKRAFCDVEDETVLWDLDTPQDYQKMVDYCEKTE